LFNRFIAYRDKKVVSVFVRFRAPLGFFAEFTKVFREGGDLRVQRQGPPNPARQKKSVGRTGPRSSLFTMSPIRREIAFHRGRKYRCQDDRWIRVKSIAQVILSFIWSSPFILW
jgi:hypothetical protein